jgi:serine/threonine-protein kinase
MRRVDGVSWMDVLTGHAPMPETFEGGDPLEAHLEIFDQVCLAAHFAHSRGILHRDIKPDNVMIGSHGEVYLVDWGLAVRFGEASHDEALPTVDQIRAPEGTPVYMAPEMVGVEVDRIGPRTDVYLLGALLHVVLMRSFRHTGDTGMMVLMAARASEPFDYPPEVPSYLARVCNKATSRALEDRHADVEELRRDVADFRRHLIAARLIEQAEAQLTVLDALAGLDEVDDDQMVLAYHSFAGAVFGFGQAIEAWPKSREARDGLADSRRAMFDVALLHGDLALCSSQLEELEVLGSDERERAGRLERARQAQQAERERVARLEQLQRDLDPLADRRLRGRVVLTCVGALVCTNVVYSSLDAAGILPIEPVVSIAYKLVDTVIMQVIIGRLAFSERVNLISRRTVHLFTVAIWGVAILRVVGVLIGLTLPQVGVVETLVYSVALAAAGVMLDRRLLLMWPFALVAAIVSFFTTDFGPVLRAFINLSMFVVLGLTWAMSKRASGAPEDA